MEGNSGQSRIACHGACRVRIFFRCLLSLFAVLPCRTGVDAQETGEYGIILSVTGKMVTAQFERREIGVGDEIEFWRFLAIVDPVSKLERGNSRSLVARGVVDEIGLGRASITVTEMIIPDRLTLADRPFATGVRKSMTRKVGRIQEISVEREEVTIDLGTSDEISEGDDFLIQRTENIYDPQTKEITGTNRVDIARGKVNTVKERTSTGKLTRVEPGMQILTTDTVVFNPGAAAAPVSVSPEVEKELRGEIERLGKAVKTLRATVDSLRQELLDHQREHETFRGGSTEPPEPPGDVTPGGSTSGTSEEALLAQYRKALDRFRAGHFRESVPEFASIMDRAPDSPLGENCRYWIAQARFNAGDYPAAATGFQAVLDDTRFIHKDDDAAIMLGITHFQAGKPTEALTALNRFLRDFPGSEYRGKAQRWISRITTTTNGGIKP